MHNEDEDKKSSEVVEVEIQSHLEASKSPGKGDNTLVRRRIDMELNPYASEVCPATAFPA